MKKPKPIVKAPADPVSPADRETRDRLAQHVMAVCVGDLSRQLADGRMPKQDVPAAVGFIASLSYLMADAMLKARDAK